MLWFALKRMVVEGSMVSYVTSYSFSFTIQTALQDYLLLLFMKKIFAELSFQSNKLLADVIQCYPMAGRQLRKWLIITLN